MLHHPDQALQDLVNNVTFTLPDAMPFETLITLLASIALSYGHGKEESILILVSAAREASTFILEKGNMN